jgi:hypothetical protein
MIFSLSLAKQLLRYQLLISSTVAVTLLQQKEIYAIRTLTVNCKLQQTLGQITSGDI